MSGKESTEHAEPRIGRTLQLARKERGLSLKQVEQATKIRARYLEELERENFDVLPAVYVQGSLKTYASFLQLDGEALARELRRRWASRHRPQDPAYVESPRGGYIDRSLTYLSGGAGAENRETTEDEGDAGATSSPVGGNLIYLSSAALLVLVAAALTLTLPTDSQPAVVSQVREPLISQAPSQVSRVGGGNEHARPQQGDDGGSVRTGQDQGGRSLAQSPRSATAVWSAPPLTQEEPASATPEAASTPSLAEAPTQRTAASVPAKVGGRVPPPRAFGRATPPPAEAPTGGSAASVPAIAGGRGEAGNISPGSRGGNRFDVQVRVGADNPVRIIGDPFNNY